jgi:hypothetical protein
MASSQFTPNLHLSAWADTDRPKRADFVSDNTIIDTQLGGHLANGGIHVTAAEKAKLTEPFTVSLYSGSGESSRVISLGFQPKLVMIYKRGVPPVSHSGSTTVVNSAIGCYGHGASVGVSLTSAGVSVTEQSTASDGVRISLNESGSQYTLIAFK